MESETGTLVARLERAAQDVEDADLALRVARERRDELIVEAVDQGVTTTRVARAAGVSQSRVMGIIAG